jgi:hypothetical protein
MRRFLARDVSVSGSETDGNKKNMDNKAQAKYLVELSLANMATGLQMIAKNRPDLAKHFMMEAAYQAAKAKQLDGEVKLGF